MTKQYKEKLVTFMNAEIAALLEDVGDRKNQEVNRKVASVYATQVYEAAPGVAIHPALPYGADGRQRLDLFVPVASTDKARPVVIFIHGGGFVGGARAIDGTPFYGNVGRFYANRGIIAVVAGYRLAPDTSWPGARDDVAAVVDWVDAHISDHGGDPARIVLHGHSAGGAHVADYIGNTIGHGRIAGAVLHSAIVDLDLYGAPTLDGIEAYYGPPETRRPTPQLADRAELTGTAMMIAIAERDPEPFMTDAAQLVANLAKTESPALFHVIPQHGHLSALLGLGTGDMSLGAALIGFIEKIG